MDEAVDGVGPRGRFETWAVSLLNLVAPSLVGLLVVHVGGAPAGELVSLGTLPGVAIFVYLWLLTAAAARRALADGGLADLRTGLNGLWRFIPHGLTADALIGAASLLGVVLVGAVLDGVPFVALALIAFISVAAASVVGGVIGASSAVPDAGCYWAADRLVG